MIKIKGLNLWIAWKYNRKNWKRLVLGGFGIAISFLLISAAFFVSDSIRNTYENEILAPLDDLDLDIRPNYEKALTFNQTLEDDIRNSDKLKDELDAVSPRLLFGGQTTTNPEKELVNTGAVLIGLNPEKDKQIGEFTQEGEPLSFDFDDLKSEDDKITLSAIITDNFAFRLQLKQKDLFNMQFQPFPDVAPLEIGLKVQQIIDSQGKAIFFSDDSIFVDLEDLQAILNLENQINSIALSWEDVSGESWIDRQDTVVKILEEFLEDDWNELVEVLHIRENIQNGIDSNSNSMLQFIFLMSLPSLIAGTFLIILIFYLVADERRKELAKLKAIGFRWWEIFIHLFIENLTLGIIGCLLGMVGGAGITELMLMQFRTELPEGVSMNLAGAQYGRDYQLYISATSITNAIIIGFFAILLPTLIVAWRISRSNIIEALTAQEMTVIPQKNRIVGLIYFGLTILLFIFALSQIFSSFTNFLLFWLIGALLMYLVLAYFIPEKGSLPVIWTCINLVLIISIFLFDIFSIFTTEPPTEIYFVGFMYAVILTCILFVQILPLLITIFSRTSSQIKQSALSIMYALANLRQHRIRTLLICVIFSLVLSIMFIFSLISGAFSVIIDSEINNITLGSDYIAITSLPVENRSIIEERLVENDLDKEVSILDSWSVATSKLNFSELSDVANRTLYDRQYYNTIGVNTSIKDGLNVKLYDTGNTNSARYSEKEIWEKLFHGEGVLLPNWYRSSLNMPLTDITIHGETENHTFEVLGYLQVSEQFTDVIISESLFNDIFPSFKGTRLIFFNIKNNIENTNEETIVKIQSDLTKALYAWGPSILSSHTLTKQARLNLSQFLGTLENFLLLGIIIGIIGIVLINVRKIQSSQFEYGILISFGASKRDLMLTTAIEVVFLVSVSILIGYTVPVFFLLPIFSTLFGVETVIPLEKLLIWAILTLLTALIGSIIPVYQILQLKPTEILCQVE